MAAAKRQERNRPEHIFVCSPLRPRSKDPTVAEAELKANLDRARRACRMVSDLGAIPYAPHLYATQFLNDSLEAERSRGRELGYEWLRDADECWVFSEHISEGMAAEIALASKLDIPVRMICESSGLFDRLIEKERDDYE